MKVGDLVKWTRKSTLSVVVHIGVVVEVVDTSIKVHWEPADGTRQAMSWMNVAWLEKV
jgi:hypothetical protein